MEISHVSWLKCFFLFGEKTQFKDALRDYAEEDFEDGDDSVDAIERKFNEDSENESEFIDALKDYAEEDLENGDNNAVDGIEDKFNEDSEDGSDPVFHGNILLFKNMILWLRTEIIGSRSF